MISSPAAIAESVSPNANSALSVDILYSALEMLTSTAQDQVVYRVDSPDGFLTGCPTLQPLVAGSSPNFADMVVNGVASLSRQVSTGQTSVGFIVTVAESTRARNELARAILIR